MKTKLRVRDKFIQYYSADEIDAVIYVCKNNSIKKSMIKIEKEVNTSGQGRIYYTTVDELLDDTKQPSFSNFMDKNLVIFTSDSSSNEVQKVLH